MDPAGFAALLAPEGQALLAELPAYDTEGALALGGRLRRRHPPELVAAALTQARLRARAVPKFGELASLLHFTPEGLEQATRFSVAKRHAQRYRDAGCRRVADLGCGIGADTLALAQAGLEVLAVDRDPLTCAVAAANAAASGVEARVEVRCADVTAVDLSGCEAAYCDPARRDGRDGGRRRFDPEAWSPPYSWVLALAERLPTGAKVAPGIPHQALPAGAEAEWVSDGGDVVEAGLWWGPMSSGVRRRATLLPAGATLIGEGSLRPPVGPVGRWLHEPDGAVIRSGLVGELAGELGARVVDETIAYLTTDELAPSAYAASYEVTDVLGFSVKRLRALLRERGVGDVVVKKRGSAVEPQALRRQLRLPGLGPTATVVLTRVAGEPTLLLVKTPSHADKRQALP